MDLVDSMRRDKCEALFATDEIAKRRQIWFLTMRLVRV